MVSFIVPAHNEQACLGCTLQAIHESARVLGQPYEIIVVDDASTDATAAIARQNGARLVSVNHRQIAATRNSGGRTANGGRFIFVDADTTANPRAVAAALQAMDKGAVGGGAPAWFEEEDRMPFYTRLLGVLVAVLTKLIGFTGGAFMFCTREAFHATGGFDERLFWAEEGSFALRLKREGRFVVLWERVLTSPRRLRTFSGPKLVSILARLLSSPFKIFTHRASVEKIWYDSDRESDDKPNNSLVAKVSNWIVMLILLVVITEPIWGFTPWSLTPLTSPLGKIRFVVGTILCHVGLLLWPLGMILFVNLLRQKRWTGLIQSLALIAFLWWQAWGATHGVIRTWIHACRWLAHLGNG
jgi:glycosyltransferase involved in cell wall biosynthesis